MAQICTTREQSKRLLELGISKNTADMSWHFTNSRAESLQWELRTTRLTTKENFFGKIGKLAGPFYKHPDGSLMTGEEVFDKIWGKDLPAWSLGALIAMMPNVIESWGEDCCLQIGAGHIQYAVPDVDGNTFAVHGDLMDCAVDTIEWLKNNEYI